MQRLLSIRILLKRATLTVRSVSISIPGKSYISVIGKDSRKFLQGLCTNDIVEALGKKRGDGIHATFLTTKGRILADTFIMNAKADQGSDDTLLVQCDSFVVNDLMRHLKLYKLRSNVQLALRSDIECDSVITTGKDDSYFNENTIGIESILVKDLRYDDLGMKKFIFSTRAHPIERKENCKNQYKIWRHMFGIGEGVELINRIPLECNLDLLRYISFTKGCYIGQELVARTKYKGVVRKRLVPFMTIPPLQASSPPNFSRLCGLRQELLKDLISKGGVHPEAVSFDEFDGNTIKEGRCKVINAEDKQVGEVISADDNGVVGLAIIRLEDLKSSSQLRAAIVPDEESIPVTGKSNIVAGVNIFPFRPDWFPDIDPITGQDIFHGI